MCALCQREQLIVESHSSGYQNHIVRNSPNVTAPSALHSAVRAVILLIDVRWSDWNSSFDSYTPIEARQAHPIAERMRQYTGINIACTQVQECREEAEQ